MLSILNCMAIKFILKQDRLSCGSFGLPEPIGAEFHMCPYDEVQEKEEAEKEIETLCVQQLSAFHEIIHVIYESNKQKYFHMDGPRFWQNIFVFCFIILCV